MGQQYNKRVVAPTAKEEDIITACLRVAWNDAFRHVSENVAKGSKDILSKIYPGDEKKDLCKQFKITENADWDEILSEHICQKILQPHGPVYDWFIDFAKAHNSSDKADVIDDGIIKGLHHNFSSVKKISGTTKPICFGHIQKLFNMALKTYACLYMCKDILNISSKIGAIITTNDLANADCPIDNGILTQLDNASHNPSISRRLVGIKTSLKVKKFATITWSKIINKDVYVCLQNAIGFAKSVVPGYPSTGVSNLWYDFKVW